MHLPLRKEFTEACFVVLLPLESDAMASCRFDRRFYAALRHHNCSKPYFACRPARYAHYSVLIGTLLFPVRSLQGAAVDSRRRTAAEFQRYATLSAATYRLMEADLSEQRRQEVPSV